MEWINILEIAFWLAVGLAVTICGSAIYEEWLMWIDDTLE